MWLAELLSKETLAWDKQCLNWLREDSVQIYFCLQGDIISSFISPFKIFFPEHLWVNFRAHKNEEVISPARAKCRICVGSYVIEILNQSYFLPQLGLFCWFQTSEGKKLQVVPFHTYVWDMNCVHVTGRLSFSLLSMSNLGSPLTVKSPRSLAAVIEALRISFQIFLFSLSLRLSQDSSQFLHYWYVDQILDLVWIFKK